MSECRCGLETIVQWQIKYPDYLEAVVHRPVVQSCPWFALPLSDITFLIANCARASAQRREQSVDYSKSQGAPQPHSQRELMKFRFSTLVDHIPFAPSRART